MQQLPNTAGMQQLPNTAVMQQLPNTAVMQQLPNTAGMRQLANTAVVRTAPTSWNVGSCSSMTLNMLASMSNTEGSWERSVRRSTLRLPQR
jgi:hypothetical protein